MLLNGKDEWRDVPKMVSRKTRVENIENVPRKNTLPEEKRKRLEFLRQQVRNIKDNRQLKRLEQRYGKWEAQNPAERMETRP